MKVLVTGATGFIGRLLVAELLSQDYQVRVLTRSAKYDFDCNVEVVVDDLTSAHFGSGEVNIFDGCDTIFNCVGEVADVEKMYAIHVDGTRVLLDKLSQSLKLHPRKFHWVQLSSVGAYGKPNPIGVSRFVSEETGLNPVGEYEITKTMADELVQNFQVKYFSFSILRPTNVVGDEMANKSFAQLLMAIRSRLFFFVGSRECVATYIHVKDVVRALILCSNHLLAKNQIFILSNDCMLIDIVKKVSEGVSRKINFLCLPEGVVRLMVKLLSGASWFPLTQSRVDFMVSKTRYSSKKIYRLLNFSPVENIADFSVAYLELLNENSEA